MFCSNSPQSWGPGPVATVQSAHTAVFEKSSEYSTCGPPPGPLGVADASTALSSLKPVKLSTARTT